MKEVNRFRKNKKFPAKALLLFLMGNSLVLHAQEMKGSNSVDDGTSISTNIFLNDDGNLTKLIHYQEPAGWVFYAAKVHEAEKLAECGPAVQDKNGHWGQSVDGVQLSLRLARTNFQVGKPINATILIRNVGNEIKEYRYRAGWSWPLNQLAVSITNSGIVLKRHADVEEMLSGRIRQLIPHTQQKYEFDLTQFYDLSKPGTYNLQASFEKSKTAVVTINITDAPAAQTK